MAEQRLGDDLVWCQHSPLPRNAGRSGWVTPQIQFLPRYSIPPDRHADIVPDTAGNVDAGRGGLSVTPWDPDDLPQHRVHESQGGTSTWPVWRIFTQKLPQALSYRIDPRRDDHGFVEPGNLMHHSIYQAEIEGTQTLWDRYIG